MRNRWGTNLLFAFIVALLGATILVSMYVSQGRPVVQQAVPGAAGLPEGHPPIDVANRLQALEKMSAGDPRNADLKAQVGNAYYDLGQFQKAIEAYNQSLELRPQDPNVETDMGTCYHFLGQSDMALQTFNHVLEYKPGFAQALFNKGIVLIEDKKDTRSGVAVWQELLKSAPDFPQRSQVEQRIRELGR